MSDEPGEDPAEATPPAPAAPAAGPGPTGDRRVDEVLDGLAALPGSPVSGHVAVFEEVHRRLQELLVSADQDDSAHGPPTPGPGDPEARA